MANAKDKTGKPIRVGLADKSPLIRTALRALFASDPRFDIVIEAVAGMVESPISITTIDGAVLHQSQDWDYDPGTDLKADYIVAADNGSPALRLSTLEDVEQLYADINATGWMNVAAFSAITLLGIGLALFLFSRLVFGPVLGLVNNLRDCAKGDLTVRVNTSGLKEFHLLGEALSRLIERLVEDVSALHGGSNQLADAVEELGRHGYRAVEAAGGVVNEFLTPESLFKGAPIIATNEALSFLKRNSKIQGVDQEEGHEHLLKRLTADPYFDGDQAELELQRALAALPEKQRLVFNMKYFDGMKYDDISEVLDTSVGALKASYHLAVKKIKKHLKGHIPDTP